MAKTKKIAPSRIVKAMNGFGAKEEKHTIGFGEDAVEITVKNFIPMQDRQALIRDVVSMVFPTDKNGETHYIPAFEEFAIEYNILGYLTNISLPTDLDEAAALVELVKPLGICDYEKNEGIRNSIRKAIEFKKTQLLRRTKLDNLLDTISELMQTIKQKVDESSLMELVEQMAKDSPDLKDSLGAIISGITEAGNLSE